MFGVVAASCAAPRAPARPQAVVWIDTDAPSPRVFDRVRITVLDADLRPVCGDACVREEELTPATPWPMSFGVAAPEADGATAARRFVRVTLYPAGRIARMVASDGITFEPAAATAIDRVVEIALGPGVVAQRVFLPLACIAQPASLTAQTSCDALGRAGMPLPLAEPAGVGAPPDQRNTRYADVVRGGCVRPASTPSAGLFDDELCIPGGVFLMGDDRVEGVESDGEAVPEHAVALPPFYLDAYEYTVGRYRAAIAADSTLDGLARVQTACAARPTDLDNRCSFGPPPGCDARQSYCCTFGDDADDRVPMTCVSRDAAARLCAHEGRRLPTEAEWEWAAGGREAERLYTWGESEAGCNDLWGLRAPPRWDPTRVCGDVVVSGPQAVGSAPFDRTVDGALDMTGSVAEWVADTFQFYGVGCWAPGAYGPGPRCADTGVGFAARGTPYAHEDTVLAVAARRRSLSSQGGFNVGFRCARDAR